MPIPPVSELPRIEDHEITRVGNTDYYKMHINTFRKISITQTRLKSDRDTYKQMLKALTNDKNN